MRFIYINIIMSDGGCTMSGLNGFGLTGKLIFLGSVGAVGGIRKGSVNKKISEGNDYYRKGRLGDAVRAYNQAIKMDPDNPIAWNNKGLILAVAGNFNESMRCHMKAFELDPKHVDAISNIGMAHTKLGNLEEAIEWYDKAIKIDPKHETTWNNKGNLLSKLEKYQEAMECYDRALEINPRYLAAMNNKAVELIHLKHYDEALALLNKVLKGRPLFSEGWYVKGKAYIGMGKFDKAIVCLERSTRLNPDFHQAKKALDILRRKLVEPPGKKTAPTEKKRPRTEREQKKMEKSIEKEILKPRSEVEIMGDEFERPDEHLTKEEKIVLEYIADDEKSKTALKKEIGNKLSMPAVQRGLEGLEKKGLIASNKMGRGTFYAKTEALGSINEEIIEEPEELDESELSNDFHAIVTRGRHYIERERYKDAARTLKKALKINPYDDMATCLMAQAHYELGDRDRAINTISKILSRKPDFIPAWFTLANSSLKHGQYQDSAECYAKILEIQPNNSEAKKGLDKANKKL